MKSLSEILSEHSSNFPARRRIMELLKEQLDGEILLYVASFVLQGAQISRDDVAPVESALSRLSIKRGVKQFSRIILIMHSPGGDLDATKELVRLIRGYCQELVIVAAYSLKSAATLMALGSDRLIMGHLSELGPVDPQIFRPGLPPISAQSYIDFYKAMKQLSGEGKLSGADIVLLHNLDPGFLDAMLKARERTRRYAERELFSHLMKGESKERIREAVKELTDVSKHLSHGRPIGPREAQKIFGKDKVQILERSSPIWQLIWELYLRADAHLREKGVAKLIECEVESITITSPQKR